MPRLLHHSRPQRLPANLASLGVPCYLHRTPMRLIVPLLGLAWLVSVGGITAIAWRAAHGRAGVAEGLMAAFLLVFAVLLTRPKTWRPPASMAADERGLYFVGSSEAEPAVFVPWSDVGPMTIERRSTGSGGGSRMVVLAIDDDSAIWERAKRSRVLGFFLGAPDDAGRRGVPIGNAGLRPQDTLEALEALRARARPTDRP